MIYHNIKKILSQPDSLPLASFIQDLIRRKLLAYTHPEFPFKNRDIAAYSSTLPNVLYGGIDPTANSLHIGNLLVLNSLVRSHFFGCFPIVLIGEATASVGDPSGHITDRNQLLHEHIHENTTALIRQLEKIKTNISSLYGEEISLEIRNNADWYKKMLMLDFFKTAKRFRVNDMLRSGPIKSRMDEGATLSYSEFSYQALQAIDWLKLFEERNCLCQIGGTDQFGNFKAGFEHIRANTERESIALCLPLLTGENGQKLGKSSEPKFNAPIWLDPSKTSAFGFYQYLRQLHVDYQEPFRTKLMFIHHAILDDVAENFLVYFSLRKITEIEEIVKEHRKHLGKWIAQKELAEEMTAIVHGNEGLENAEKCSKILFKGDLNSEINELNPAEIVEMFGSASTFNISLGSIKTMGELAALTKRDGINLMRTGALKINSIKMTDPEEEIDIGRILIKGQFTIVCWGKRKFALISWF